MPEIAQVSSRSRAVGFLVGMILVVALAIIAAWISKIPEIKYWGLEYVLWAVVLGLLVRNTIIELLIRKKPTLGVQERLTTAFRPELFIKTGLVLLGTSVNFYVILRLGAKGIVQALLVVITVFLVAYYVARRLGIDKKFAAVLSAGVSICGVSAAIAAGESVLADRKQVVYAVTLVVAFAIPMLVALPVVARALGMPDTVAGAWIGGNIDTTPAVAAAAQIFSDQAVEVATIVKIAQNALIGVVAFLLATYFALVVEKKSSEKPSPKVIWNRFPKFILGFMFASVLATIGVFTKDQLTVLGNLTKWLFAITFVSIGLSTAIGDFGKIGRKPLLVFLSATIYNTILTFTTAWLLFGGILPM